MAPDRPAARLAQCSGASASLLRDSPARRVSRARLGLPARRAARCTRLAPDVPILLQDHADRVPRFWRRCGVAARRSTAAAAYRSAHARRPSRSFTPAWCLPTRRVFEIPESTSTFTPGDCRRRARRDRFARRSRGAVGRPSRPQQGSADGARRRRRRRYVPCRAAALVLLRRRRRCWPAVRGADRARPAAARPRAPARPRAARAGRGA